MTGTYTKVKTRMLTAEEERELFKEYQATGSPRAKVKIVDHFKPLVLKRAALTSKRSPSLGTFDFEDIHQEALIGLLLAVDRFDLGKEVRFASYAIHWVDGRLYKFVLENCYQFKMNARAIKKMHDIIQQYRDELSEAGEDVDLLTIDHSKLTREQSSLLNILDAKRFGVDSEENARSVSIDETEKSLFLVDESVNTELEVADKLKLEALYRAMEETVLTDRERDIITIRFQEDSLPLREVGEKYGISTERARQIQSAALRKIRETYDKNNKAPTG